MSKTTVTTWADGFGNWHAKVVSDLPTGDETTMALAAVRAELAERAGPNFDPKVVAVALKSFEAAEDMYGTTTTMTYAEASMDEALESMAGRSVFMDFPTAAQAAAAIPAMAEASVVKHHVVNVSYHADDPLWSVYFVLDDPDQAEEDAFKAAATALGGTYSGS